MENAPASRPARPANRMAAGGPGSGEAHHQRGVGDQTVIDAEHPGPQRSGTVAAVPRLEPAIPRWVLAGTALFIAHPGVSTRACERSSTAIAPGGVGIAVVEPGVGSARRAPHTAAPRRRRTAGQATTRPGAHAPRSRPGHRLSQFGEFVGPVRGMATLHGGEFVEHIAPLSRCRFSQPGIQVGAAPLGGVVVPETDSLPRCPRSLLYGVESDTRAGGRR